MLRWGTMTTFRVVTAFSVAVVVSTAIYGQATPKAETYAKKKKPTSSEVSRATGSTSAIPSEEYYFIEENYSVGVTSALSIVNLADAPTKVTIERFRGGKLANFVAKTIDPQSKMEVRVEDDAYQSWLHVKAEAPVIVTGTYEILSKDVLREIPMAVQEVHSSCIQGNDVLPSEVTALDESARPQLVVANVSDQQMKVGFCQDKELSSRTCYPDLTVIAPKTSTVFPIDIHKPYVVLRMSGCSAYLLGTSNKVDGLMRTFQTDSSVSFGPEK